MQNNINDLLFADIKETPNVSPPPQNPEAGRDFDQGGIRYFQEERLHIQKKILTK